MTLADVRSKTDRIREYSAIPFLLVAAVSLAGRVLPACAAGGHRRPDQLGRHRLDADGTGAGAADDAGPVVLLRRHGPLQERRLDDAAELRRAGRDQPALGRWSASAWPSATSIHGLIGNPRTFFMFTASARCTHPALAPTIPLLVFALFQLKFAIITPALITGSFAERVRFSSYLLFMCLFSLFIYSPLAHWTWHPDGFLHKWACSTSPAARSCTCRPASRRWPGAMVLGRRTTHMNGEAHHAGQRPVRAARHGHALVRLVRLQRRLGAGGQRARRRWPSRPPTRPRRRRCSAGCSSTGCAARSRRRSAPASARWSAWSRSRPRPASSRSARASSSAWSPASSATWRCTGRTRRRSTTRSTSSPATASAAWSACS